MSLCDQQFDIELKFEALEDRNIAIEHFQGAGCKTAFTQIRS